MRAPRPLRFGGIALGLALVLVGVITAPTPVPLGLILTAAGLTILVALSRTMRRLVYGIRRRYPALSARLRRATPYLPRRLGRMLTRTDPQRSQVDEPSES